MNDIQKMRRAFLIGILSSFFFAFTFILNRSMNLGGGFWLWSATLRYYFTLPLMLILLLFRHQLTATLSCIRKDPLRWILWSTVGFGLFYAPLTAASVFAESWFTCATWQITVVAGIFLTPLFGRRIPKSNLLFSGIILLGVFIMQIPQAHSIGGRQVIISLCLTLVAAFSYPLGNRKMMQLCGNELTTNQRVFGMTLCSMPFWICTGILSGVYAGAPSGAQALQSLLVALFSGVIATILFFYGTDMVRHNQRHIAVVESTAAGEVIFTLILGILLLKDTLPSPVALIGILLIIAGMILNNFVTK